jgi:hypothetical protein
MLHSKQKGNLVGKSSYWKNKYHLAKIEQLLCDIVFLNPIR